MKLSPKQRQLAIVGGWIFTAAAAFSFGRMTNWLDAPVNPQSASAGHGTGNGGAAGPNGGVNQGNSALADRIGGSFKTDGTGGTSGRTLAEITGNQPVEDWLKKLMNQDDDIFRMKNFLDLVQALDNPEDIKTALKVIGASQGGNRRGGFGGGRFSEYGMLMEKFTQIDPKAALTFAGEQKGPEKFMATATAMRSWARLDPSAALSWAQTEGANLQMDFGGRGPGGPGGGGPPGADGQDTQPKENFALMTVIGQLAKTDLDKAMSSASTAEIGRMGGRMVDTLAAEMVSQRGPDAARKAVDSLPDGDFKNEYIQQLAGQLAATDAPGTAQWAKSLTDGDAKRRALGTAIGQWAQTDPTAAGTFLGTLPMSESTDSARERYAIEVGKQNPAAALPWVNTITDPKRLEQTQIALAPSYFKVDPAGAQQWVSTLAPEQQARITAQAKGGNNGGGGNRFGGGGGGGGRRGGGN